MSNPSKWIGFALGAVEVAVGAVLLFGPGSNALGLSLIISGSTMIVSQAVVDLTAPKTPARDAQEMELQLGEQPRCALFGTCFTAGSLVDAWDYGGDYGTDHEVLLIRLADHACDSLVGFYVNDQFITFTGNGNVPEFNGEHYEMLHIQFRPNTTTEALSSEVTANWPGHAAGDVGASGCDVAVIYRCDTPKGKNPIWPGGRPRFGFVVKGKKCYDPRLDDTVGGSGSHRWDDPTTWEWSENAAVCRYNWARGIYANDDVSNPAALLIGRGLSADEAPPENIFAAANLCDETVGSGVRYRVAGPIYSNQEFIDVEGMFAAATGGSTVTRQGSVELEPGAAKSVLVTITDDDLLVGSKVSWNRGVLSESSDEWINSVTANYVEPTQHWADHAAPVVRDPADIIADGKPREAQLSLRLVKDVGQAQRVADIGRKMGRLWGRATVTLGPRFCQYEDGDWIRCISARRGFDKTFRIEAYQIDENWRCTWTLREISSACFDGSTFQPDYSDPVTVTTPPPSVTQPSVADGSWALAAVTLTSSGASVPALEITGNSFPDDDQAEAVIIEYWKDDGVIDPTTNPDDPAWIMEGSHAPGTLKVDITSVEGGATYWASITYQVSGDLGDRLVLGPVTVADVDVSGGVTAASSADVTASEAIAAGSFVNIYSSSGAKVRKANATDDTKPVNGYVEEAIANGATGSVRGTGGKVSGLAGLTPGATYFLDTTAGAITVTPPSGSGNLVQEVGVAVSATELLFHPKQGVTL